MSLEPTRDMKHPLVRKNEAGALENDKRQTCEHLFDYADGGITGCQAADTLAGMQKAFDEGRFNDEFALSLFDTAFVFCLMIAENGFSIDGDTEDR